MQFRRISADCHLDLPWLPAGLFVSDARRELRNRILAMTMHRIASLRSQ
ncbi:MAG TPA: hypothetical protein VMF86_15840 [Stellaceae bacterium]|nr:hypothetical protein [Stellaceae bacterium]